MLTIFLLDCLERTYHKAPQNPPTSVFVYGVNPSTIKVVWRYVSPNRDEEPLIGYKVCNYDLQLIKPNNLLGSVMKTSLLKAYLKFY